MLKGKPLSTTVPGGEESKGSSLKEEKQKEKWKEKKKKRKSRNHWKIQLLKIGKWWSSLWSHDSKAVRAASWELTDISMQSSGDRGLAETPVSHPSVTMERPMALWCLLTEPTAKSQMHESILYPTIKGGCGKEITLQALEETSK